MMTESDRLVAMFYAASTHSLDEFLTRYQDCVTALAARQNQGQKSRDADATAELGDSLGGPA